MRALQNIVFILRLSLKRELWVLKAGHSLLPTPSQYYKFSDEKKIRILLPLILLLLSFPGPLELSPLIIKH